MDAHYLHELVSHIFYDTHALLGKKAKEVSREAKVLFLLFDAGETKALEPVMKELEATSFAFQVLAFGTAWELMKHSPHTINIHQLLGISTDVDQRQWDRTRALETRDINKLCSILSPDVVLSGAVSEIQRQVIVGLKQKGADIILFYDSFAPIQNFDFTPDLLKYSDIVLVPSKNVADSIQALSPNVKIDIVGQPIIEQWNEENERLDKEKVKQQLRLDSDEPLLVYVCGYGEGYQESFTSFVQAIRFVDHLNICIALHPKMDGQFEREILDNFDCNNILWAPPELETSHLVGLADLVITWRSTVGVQAAFLGKPVIYLDHPGSTYSSLAIEKGWAIQIFDSNELLKLLIEFEKAVISSNQRFEESGIPIQSKQLILKKLLKLP